MDELTKREKQIIGLVAIALAGVAVVAVIASVF